MTQNAAIPLRDGRLLQTSAWTYPIGPDQQQRLIALLRTEWRQTDFDWLQAMNGDYSETLTIRSVVGCIDGVDVGTASIYYAKDQPEVSLLGNVLTHRDFRRLQIAQQLTDFCVQSSFETGCRVTYLGTTRSPRCVYLNCGFDWVSGGVMRRPAPGAEEVEAELFAANQSTTIREANWGDLPGVALLVAQPSDALVIDYPRGILSPSFASMGRCVSNFPVIWYDVANSGGTMCVLSGDKPGRVLGFGSLTPGMGQGRRHLAVIEITTHDSYRNQARRLMKWLSEKALQKRIQVLQAHVASHDQYKAELFHDAGFRPVAELDKQLCIGDRVFSAFIYQRDNQL